MPHPRVVLRPTDADIARRVEEPLRARFAAVRSELGIAGPYPADALAEAERVAAAPPQEGYRDETDVPYVTLDPPGSMDLDQALHLERAGEGYRVRYAIADVPAFVRAGGALDEVTRQRGQTVYCPDARVPLHPPVLSEAAASLLPGAVRPAFVWDLALDAEGVLTAAEVRRALVRSRERLDYAGVQAAVDGGRADERLVLLREVGERRIARERARGGASLPMPEQQVSAQDDGGFTLEFRPPVPAEEWNAQLSLLTGMAAARMMLDGGVGVLRTMPAPTPEAVARFRRAARGLGVEWPEGVPYGDLVRGLDRSDPHHLALIHEATSLFRGATYTAFAGQVPEQPEHAAVAAPYAHVTAPLRRLVDRFGLLVCEALARGREVPDPVRAALPTLTELMTSSDRVARTAERACADATEAAVLTGREGERFAAVVVDHTEKGMEVQLVDLPVLADVRGGRGPLGSAVTVRLESADVASGRVVFAAG
ncbi:RNB domain-containing ribonuclease [Phycicoccus endophyticus]|uniref:RNB domain-containing ribonuclease n=1 Tax=Phycicoccus endophyticus TaxID=1690220 RepID=A0A7G9R415_9MICO|nr:RNB domain-containing ribonuclease [Phycicoccus endophyticus]NHI18179.1 RNB domain-containing ribonuclease [Phycicoccus endophyticus]QNN50340.1 RNB domain-containing ribonuclease [Phycicoccus endophyticus]GGL25862.1 exoribonuclease R [Phycicoccus endophyticus]